MRRIVAAIDFSDVTDTIVETAIEFASALGGTIVLFHVAPAADPWVDTAFDRYTVGVPTVPGWAEAEAKRREVLLSGVRESLLAKGLGVTVHLGRGDNHATICEELAALEPGMIILGSHRHGMFHDLLLGGVCPRVVRQAPCPVLVVHAGDPLPHYDGSRVPAEVQSSSREQ